MVIKKFLLDAFILSHSSCGGLNSDHSYTLPREDGTHLHQLTTPCNCTHCQIKERQEEDSDRQCESDIEEDDYEDGNLWNSYLYMVQLEAPKPYLIVCENQINNKPGFYGKEYHGSITRQEAETLVMTHEGAYLTRESQRQPGTYALTFMFNGSPRNYKLYYDEEEKLHFVGEKRFETIHNLVADGLITMHVERNAKDYINTMTLNVKRTTSRTYATIEVDDDSNIEHQSDSTDNCDAGSIVLQRTSFRASQVAKKHNFKVHNYYGPHWCEYCRNFMWGLKSQGVRCQDCSFDCHKQCSSLVPHDCSPRKDLVTKVYGVDLTTLIKAHNCKRPKIVDSCIQEIEKRGLSVEGLYRVPGSHDEMDYMKEIVDREGVRAFDETYVDDINVLCGLLKLYFRMLPIPLIPFDLYNDFIQCAKTNERNEAISRLRELVPKLPLAHLETLKYVLRHLQNVTNFQDKNLMTSANLGIVFGPTLMRAPDDLAMQALANIGFQKLVVQYLIEEQDILFSS